METIIEVEGIRLRAFHGVSAQENKVGNIFVVSVGIRYAYKYMSDEISDTINYADIIEIVKNDMSISSKLIEHAASRIHDSLIRKWNGITGGYIKIEKLHPPINDEIKSAAVTLKW